MAGWESGPGKASTALEDNHLNFQKRNFTAPDLQIFVSSEALFEAA